MGLAKSGNIPIRHAQQQDCIRKAGQMARDILLKTAAEVHAGVTTGEPRPSRRRIRFDGCCHPVAFV